MVADSSALIAILRDEPERHRLNLAIEAAPVRLVSVATVLEASIAIEVRKDEAAGRELDLLLHYADFEIVPVDRGQLEVARRAFRAYGKGRHPARLNFGDCFSYALAKVSGEPLLFKGGDFALTDVAPVNY